MADMVISGAPVSVLLDHGLDEHIVEKLVAADIGTVERLGSMTPEELEAIPDIDEDVVTQIQSAVVSFYGQYDDEQEAEAAPAERRGSIEAAIDARQSREIREIGRLRVGSIPALSKISKPECWSTI